MKETDAIKRLEKIASRQYHDEGFNERLISYRSNTIVRLCKGPNILEVGCGDGLVTQKLVSKFDYVVALDGSKIRIERAKKRIEKTHKKGEVLFVESLFEDFKTKINFNSVVMSELLEHLNDPVQILKKAKKMLKDDGYIMVVVPNAKSLHRRLGTHMGIISDVHQLEKHDIFVGHKRYYDSNMLKRDIHKAGLKIDCIGGIFLKPFSNRQMESLSPEITNALYLISDELPEYCAEIYARCKKR